MITPSPAVEESMSTLTITLTDDLYRYLREVSLREPELLHRLRTETQRLEMARMQISPEQGQFMRLIAMLIGARKARSEEHTSELQSLMRISYDVLCLKK